MFDVQREGHWLQMYAKTDGGMFRTKGPDESFWKTIRLKSLFPIHLYNGLLYALRREPVSGGERLIPIKPPPGDKIFSLLMSNAVKDGHECVRLRYSEPVDRKTTEFDIYLEYDEVYDWVKYIDENMTC